jgi:ribosomal protein L25 (general stress protein Ctc)
MKLRKDDEGFKTCLWSSNFVHRFYYYVSDMSMGDILALGIHYNLDVDNGNIDDVYDAFEVLTAGHVTGKSVMRGIRNHDAYSAIVYKGKVHSASCTVLQNNCLNKIVFKKIFLMNVLFIEQTKYLTAVKYFFCIFK